MKKLFNIGLCLAMGIMSFSFLALPTYAQFDEDYTTTTYDDWDWDYDYSYDTTEDLTGLAGLLGGAGLLFSGVAMVFSLVISLGFYVYSALALMNIAKKLGHENSWFAWIPILNAVLLFQMGDRNPWLLLVALIPGLGALIVGILAVIALMTICEKRGYDKLLGLLALVPIANLILFGILAWGKKE